MLVNHTVEIDCSADADEIVEQWLNGNKNDVIHQLATDHAGLVAMVLVHRDIVFSDRLEFAARLWAHRNEIGLAKLNETK